MSASTNAPSTRNDARSLRPLSDLPVPIWLFTGVIVLVCAFGIAVVLSLMSLPVEAAHQTQAMRSQDASHSVVFCADFQGGTYDECSSRIPVRITGESLGGVPYDMTVYLAREGWDVRLPLGSYDVRVLASPIASDGTVYEVPANVVHIEMGETMAASDRVIVPEEHAFKFVAIDPADLTDEQVAEALRWVVRDTDPSVDEETLGRVVEARRDAASA